MFTGITMMKVLNDQDFDIINELLKPSQILDSIQEVDDEEIEDDSN